MPFELIIGNRSLHSMFFHTLRCALSEVTWRLGKGLILNNAGSVIRTYESWNSTDESVATNFEKMKIRAARAPSVFLRDVFSGKISHLSADYYGGAWSWHKIKRVRRMIECKKKNFLKQCYRDLTSRREFHSRWTSWSMWYSRFVIAVLAQDSGYYSWRIRSDVDVCEGRNKNQIAWNFDRTMGPGFWCTTNIWKSAMNSPLNWEQRTRF